MTPQIRRLALHKQGLTSFGTFGKGLAGVRKTIQHLGYIQIDTLSVVERSHHHILWSRVPGYRNDHLNRLTQKKDIFEYWFHAASYLPISSYRYALPQMMTVRQGKHRYFQDTDKRLMTKILAKVNADGPLRLRDLDSGNRKRQGVWSRGPAQRALDRLFMQGDLMVCRRDGMEKVYDLRERCLPAAIDTSMPTTLEYATYLFDTTLRAHGVVTWKQLVHLKTGKPMRDAMRQVLDERLAAGVISPIDKKNKPATYVETSTLHHRAGTTPTVKVLSPFDNVVIHRERLQALFGFDYRMECYLPASKRQYGYFCLPILYGDRFVGRMDCKAHRADERFEILSLHLEPGSRQKSGFFDLLEKELRRFAEFNGCSELDMQAVSGRRV